MDENKEPIKYILYAGKSSESEERQIRSVDSRVKEMLQIAEREELEVANDQWSGRKLYHWLRFDINFRTTSQKHLALGNIYRILQNTFYYGTFEYPQNSGNWYTGKHEPLISRELFEKAQKQLSRNPSTRQETKEFAFTKLMTCGLCESGVTAQEKFKHQKNGNVHRYVYYSCTRSKNLHCKNKYIREVELIQQLVELIPSMDMDKKAISKKFEDEYKRMRNFQKSFLGSDQKNKPNQRLDIKQYATYVLTDGTMEEKRELLGTVKNKLILKDKRILLN